VGDHRGRVRENGQLMGQRLQIARYFGDLSHHFATGRFSGICATASRDSGSEKRQALLAESASGWAVSGTVARKLATWPRCTRSSSLVDAFALLDRMLPTVPLAPSFAEEAGERWSLAAMPA
jgi:hypothetical protein